MPARFPRRRVSSSAASDAAERIYGSRGAIQRIVIIIQENRTVDNLFNGLPGADTNQRGKEHERRGDRAEADLADRALHDMSHRHEAWQNDYNGGAMNRFNTEPEVPLVRALARRTRRHLTVIYNVCANVAVLGDGAILYVCRQALSVESRSGFSGTSIPH